MSNSYYHAVSSARRWGGQPEEYIHLHGWIDEPKLWFGDFRARALRHHTQGIYELKERFGITLKLETGIIVPVAAIAEQHMIEDFGRIPSVQDWLSNLKPQPWMASKARKLSIEL